MKEREQYLDILRTLACILIVLTHSAPPAQTGSSAVHAFVSFACSPSSELFLAISGALLLPVRRTTREFLSKRFVRVFPPLLFWSCVVIAYRFLSQSAPAGEIWRSFVTIPIKPVVSVYWFFYVISGLYIFAPVISKWMLNASRREIRFFICLWSITLALGSAGMLLGTNLINIQGDYYFILNSFGGFFGFMLLGSYLRNHTAARTLRNNIVIPLAILFGLFAFAVAGYKLRIVTVDFFIENLSLPTALMVYAIFMLIKDLKIANRQISRIISEIALCSYGIYLIHIFIARDVVWSMLAYTGLAGSHPAIMVAVSLALSLVISYIVVRAIKFLPFGKYLVG